jgi:hypothetical protein
MVWLGNLAAQVASFLEKHPDAVLDSEMAAYVIVMWEQLASKWMGTPTTAQLALGMMPPGMLRLLEHLAHRPPSPSRAAAAEEAGRYTVKPVILLLCADAASRLCGTVLEGLQQQDLPYTAPSPPTSFTPSSSSSRHSSSSMARACGELVAAITDYEVSSTPARMGLCNDL